MAMIKILIIALITTTTTIGVKGDLAIIYKDQTTDSNKIVPGNAYIYYVNSSTYDCSYVETANKKCDESNHNFQLVNMTILYDENKHSYNVNISNNSNYYAFYNPFSFLPAVQAIDHFDGVVYLLNNTIIAKVSLIQGTSADFNVIDNNNNIAYVIKNKLARTCYQGDPTKLNGYYYLENGISSNTSITIPIELPLAHIVTFYLQAYTWSCISSGDRAVKIVGIFFGTAFGALFLCGAYFWCYHIWKKYKQIKPETT